MAKRGKRTLSYLGWWETGMGNATIKMKERMRKEWKPSNSTHKARMDSRYQPAPAAVLSDGESTRFSGRAECRKKWRKNFHERKKIESVLYLAVATPSPPMLHFLSMMHFHGLNNMYLSCHRHHRCCYHCSRCSCHRCNVAGGVVGSPEHL